MEPLIVGRVITNHGFKEVALIGGSSDNIYSVDADRQDRMEEAFSILF